MHSENETLFFHVRVQIARMQPENHYRAWAEAHGAVESVGVSDMPTVRCMWQELHTTMPCRFCGLY